jgi:hypothetical protein
MHSVATKRQYIHVNKNNNNFILFFKIIQYIYYESQNLFTTALNVSHNTHIYSIDFIFDRSKLNQTKLLISFKNNNNNEVKKNLRNYIPLLE